MDNDIKHSISKKDENPPKEPRAFHDRWSDFGKKDPLDIFLEETSETEQQKRKPIARPAPDPKQEELNRLYLLLYERDKEFEKAKGKRTIITVLFLTAVYFVLLFCFSIFAPIAEIKSIFDVFSTDIRITLGILVVSFVLAWIHFMANLTIFGQLYNMGRAETETLERIKKLIEETKRRN